MDEERADARLNMSLSCRLLLRIWNRSRVPAFENGAIADLQSSAPSGSSRTGIVALH